MRIIYGIIIIVAILVGLLYSPIGIPATYTEENTMVITSGVDFSKIFKSSGTKILNAPMNQSYADNSETMSEGVNEGISEGVNPNFSVNTVSNNITTQEPTFQNNRSIDKNTSVPSNSGVWVSFGSKKSQVESSGQATKVNYGFETISSDVPVSEQYDSKKQDCLRHHDHHNHNHHNHNHHNHNHHPGCPGVPIGDGLMILSLLVLLYAGYITFIIKQSKNHEK